MASFSFVTVVDSLSPTITPLAPLAGAFSVALRAPIDIRLEDDDDIDLSTLQVVVNGTTYVLAGAAQNGAVLSTEANEGNGFDIRVRLPAAFPTNATQSVTVTVEDTFGNSTTLPYTFSTTRRPRLLRVTNPQEGVLIAVFSGAMVFDAAFLSPESWRITPVSEGARELVIVDVKASSSHPNQAVLRYEGGGSTYLLTVSELLSSDSDPVDAAFNSVEFEILFGTDQPISVRLFNSVFGPLGISQREVTRRTVEKLVVNRAIALGFDAQIKLRLKNYDNGSAGRDGRPGVRRT